MINFFLRWKPFKWQNLYMENLYMDDSSVLCELLQTKSFCFKNLKDNRALLSFNKRIFIKYIFVDSDELFNSSSLTISSVLLDHLTSSIMTWTFEIEETATPRNDCIIHKYRLHFWHFRQTSVHNESDRSFLKSHVFKFNLVYGQSIKRSGKENETKQLAIELQ